MDGNITVMFVTLVIWAGLFFFLIRLDKRVRKLEGKAK